MPSRGSRVNCHRSKLVIYIKILVLTMLLPRDQKEAIYNLLSLSE